MTTLPQIITLEGKPYNVGTPGKILWLNWAEVSKTKSGQLDDVRRSSLDDVL